MDTEFLRLMTHRAALLLLALSAALPVQAKELWGNASRADGLLAVDQAFALQPVLSTAGKITAQWIIAPGYYLYLDRLQFASLEPAGLTLKPARLPKGERIHDEHFGDSSIQRQGLLTAEIPLTQAVQRLQIRYQGCAEIGVCYPPQTRVISLTPKTP